MFNILPGILNEPFIVSTPIGESVVEKKVYRKFPIMFPHRDTHVEVVEHDIVYVDVILGMDWF